MPGLRHAVPADAEAMAVTVAEGFETYRSFAPDGWEPPDRLEVALALTMRLRRPHVRAWAAEDAQGVPVGHVTYLPAFHARHASDEPGLAHLEQLFVRPAHWGTSMARELMAMAVRDAGAGGFTAMRLFTATGQLRGRRFYEREGWSAVGDAWVEPPLDLEIIEYRRPLP